MEILGLNVGCVLRKEVLTDEKEKGCDNLATQKLSLLKEQFVRC